MAMLWFMLALLPLLGSEAAPLDLSFGGVYNGPEAQNYWQQRFGANFFGKLAAFQKENANNNAQPRAPSRPLQTVNFGAAVVPPRNNYNNNVVVANNNNNEVVALKSKVGGVRAVSHVPVYRPRVTQPLFPRVNNFGLNNFGVFPRQRVSVVDNFVVANNNENNVNNNANNNNNGNNGNNDVSNNVSNDNDVNNDDNNDKEEKEEKEEEVVEEESKETKEEELVVVDEFVVGKTKKEFELDSFENLVEEFQIASNRV